MAADGKALLLAVGASVDEMGREGAVGPRPAIRELPPGVLLIELLGTGDFRPVVEAD